MTGPVQFPTRPQGPCPGPSSQLRAALELPSLWLGVRFVGGAWRFGYTLGFGITGCGCETEVRETEAGKSYHYFILQHVWDFACVLFLFQRKGNTT